MQATVNENTANIPAFLGKLWKMVNDPSTDHLICWSPSRNSFIIQNQAQFWYELLPLYYKHNNMSSFVRQLNMYGFHKMSTVENGSMDSDKDEIQFYHPFFQKDQPELLKNIKRKVTGSKTHDGAQTTIRSDDLAKVLSDVKHLRGRQSSVDAQLTAMKQENAVLWRELAILRQKHLQQQQIVNKLIQFLVTLVQPSASGRMGVGVKRRMPLMLYEGPNKKQRVRKLSNNNQDSGPTIHELDNEIEIYPDELLEDEEVIEVDPQPREKSQETGQEAEINSPTTPSTSLSSSSSTNSQCSNSKSPSTSTSGLVDDVSQDTINADFLWDKPEFVNITHPEDSLSDNDTREENLIDTLQNNQQTADERVFLNPHNRDTLLSNLIGNGAYNVASIAGKTSTNAKKQNGNQPSSNVNENFNPVSQDQNNDMTIATRATTPIKINTGTSGTNGCFREDLDVHLEHTQSEIDQLKDILNSCNTLDANTLLGLFNDAPDYGLANLSNTPKGMTGHNDSGDPLVSGNEVATVDNNLFDFNELFDESVDGQENSIIVTEPNLLSEIETNQALDTPLIVKNEPAFY